MTNVFIADFETTSYKFYVENGYTKVWLWAICDLEGNIQKTGDSIETFIDFCRDNVNSEIYFHNLKFDGSFILNYLLKNGFPLRDKIVKKSNKGVATLISSDGVFYSITFNFARNKRITLYDSLKLLPLKVSTIAKAMKMEIQKGVIDYEDYTINDESIEYIEKDVKIVAKGLKYFKELGLNKMTIGSNAYNEFKESQHYFNMLFPKLERSEVKNFRLAYRGGRSQVNPLYKGKVVKNVYRYDINSMYPYALKNMYIPYGKPIKLKDINKMKFELYRVAIDFKLKKNHLPTLLKKGGLFSNVDTYYTETEHIEELWVSNIDLELVKRHYDIAYIKFIEIYGFKTIKGVFNEYIDKYYNLKNNTTGGEKLIYKLMLNSLYGKFGSKESGVKKIPYIDDDEDTLRFKNGDIEDMRIYYIPVAIQVTSFCHKLIDDYIMEVGYSNFVYCDTDSVHTLVKLDDKFIGKEIGKMKLEGIELISKYVRQKCYVYKEKDDMFTVVCSGMTEGLKNYLIRACKDDEIFDYFKEGLTLDSKHLINNIPYEIGELKTIPIQVPGGVVLAPTIFSING